MTSILRSNVTEVIKSGGLVKGTVVSLWSDQAPVETYGHITSSASVDGNYIDIVAISRPGDVEMHLGYFGTNTPMIMRPDFIDTAISSPFLLAMAIIFSIFASTSQFYGDVRKNTKRVIKHSTSIMER